MKESSKKEGRGGARPGSGRPKEHYSRITFRAPEYMIRHIDTKDDKSGYIRECIDRDIEREPDFSKVGVVMRADDAEPINIAYFENNKVVAGFPIPLDNDEKAQTIDLLRMLCPHPESCYLIKVTGDSMKDADIHDGDVIIVDKSNRNPGENEVAMCEFNGEYTVKYVRKRDGVGYLVPANKDYPEWKISPDDEFYVWGVVTKVIHDL